MRTFATLVFLASLLPVLVLAQSGGGGGANPEDDLRRAAHIAARRQAQGQAGAPTAPQLLALQLHARGYSAAQIGQFIEQSPRGVAVLLQVAAQRIGTADLATAIAEARRRGLIV